MTPVGVTIRRHEGQMPLPRSCVKTGSSGISLIGVLMCYSLGVVSASAASGRTHQIPFSLTTRGAVDMSAYRYQDGVDLLKSTIILAPRGGGSDERYDTSDIEGGSEGEYDDYDDGNKDGGRSDRGSQASGYDHSLVDPPPMDSKSVRSAKSRDLTPDGFGDSDDVNHRRRRGPPPPMPSRRGKRPKHWSQRIASQSLKMGSQLAWGAVQQTGKVAYQLVKPRHVDARELLGLWRLDQQIVSNGRDMASVATIELDPRKGLLKMKLPNGKTVVEPYTFLKTRLGSFQTEFVAPAFLVGDTPRLYGYRGTWQRKLADKRVIKLVGKIYSVRKQRFGKESGKYLFAQPVGTFVARRRMKLSEEEDDDEAGDDDGDEYEGEDDDELSGEESIDGSDGNVDEDH